MATISGPEAPLVAAGNNSSTGTDLGGSRAPRGRERGQVTLPDLKLLPRSQIRNAILQAAIRNEPLMCRLFAPTPLGRYR